MYNVLLICVLTLATVPGLPPAQTQTAALDKAIDGIIFGGMPFTELITLADFEKRLGKPVSVRTEAVENRHTSDKDVVHHFVYKGLTLDLYEVTHDHSVIILRVELSDNRWNFPAKIRVGSTRGDVSRLLGKATRGSNSEWEYLCSDCVYENTITFKFSSEKVVSMKWEFALD